MKAYVLALILGIGCLSGLAFTPAQAEAREWRSAGDTVSVAWRGGSHYRVYRGGSHYYTPSYYYGAQSYYPYAPSYSSYDYVAPRYNSYYYAPAVVPSYAVPSYQYDYYRPGVRVYIGR